MTGYSGTPLAQKLGLAGSHSLCALHVPAHYAQLLPEFYADMAQILSGELDWIHAFYKETAVLKAEFAALKSHLASNGQLWISWPKKSSGTATDLSENIVRAIGLDHGLVDVKVAAIDDEWSAIKFVYRLSDRSGR